MNSKMDDKWQVNFSFVKVGECRPWKRGWAESECDIATASVYSDRLRRKHEWNSSDCGGRCGRDWLNVPEPRFPLAHMETPNPWQLNWGHWIWFWPMDAVGNVLTWNSQLNLWCFLLPSHGVPEGQKILSNVVSRDGRSLDPSPCLEQSSSEMPPHFPGWGEGGCDWVDKSTSIVLRHWDLGAYCYSN